MASVLSAKVIKELFIEGGRERAQAEVPAGNSDKSTCCLVAGSV